MTTLNRMASLISLVRIWESSLRTIIDHSDRSQKQADQAGCRQEILGRRLVLFLADGRAEFQASCQPQIDTFRRRIAVVENTGFISLLLTSGL